MQPRYFIFALFLMLVSQNIQAQNYHPFPTKNARWAEYYMDWGNELFETHFFALKDQDTTINNKIYHKIYHSTDTLFTEDKLLGGIREEDKKVYLYAIDAIDSINYLFQHTYPSRKKEVLLFDFSLKVGDSIYSDTHNILLADYPGYLEILKIDSILTGSEYRKRIWFGKHSDLIPLSTAAWIEGIGSYKGLLFPIGDEPESHYNYLTCFSVEGVALYNPSGKCDCVTKTNLVNKATKLEVRLKSDQPGFTVYFNGKNYTSLRLVDSFGAVRRVYNINGAASLEIRKENLATGVYLLVANGPKQKIATAKVAF